MFSVSRLALTLYFVSLICPCRRLQAQSLVPRTPSQNLTEAIPPAFPAYSKIEGDILTITGRQTKTYFIKGKPLAYKPDPTGVPGILRTYFLVNNKTLNADAVSTGEALPIYSFVRTESDALGRHVQVVGLTEANKRYSLADCMVYSYPPPLSLDYTAQMNGERGEFNFKNREKLGTVYCYLNGECLGRLNKASTAACDLRHLPPGNYRFAAIAETPDGYLLPFESYAFTIAPRYRLELPQAIPEVAVTVPTEQPNATLVLRAVKESACSATVARVFVDDTYLGEVTADSPEIALPLRDLPTGKILVEVVPVGKGKFDYPAETIGFTLKNTEWEQKTYKTPSYAQIRRNDKRIASNEREAVAWMAKAEAQPSFSLPPNSQSQERSHTGEFHYTLLYLSSLKMTGRAGEYVGNARAAVLEMAQLTLENARLHRQLRMMDAAKANYHRVLYLAGSTTNTGSLADGELNAMLLRKR